jgi:hypothetical protein
LFSVANYAEAWSPTILNHHYLYSDSDELSKNWKYKKKRRDAAREPLYLGRFIRFTSGLQKPVLDRYNHEGAPVDGLAYTYSAESSSYVKKIVELCAANNIELVFLTLPMYHRHIKNYSAWKQTLGSLLNQQKATWLDLQDQSMEDFTAECFENTYNSNQHMTFKGSLIATSKLATFVRSTVKVIPDRRYEKEWLRNFYGKEGYMEYNSPLQNDPNNKVFSGAAGSLLIKEFITARTNSGSTLIAKIDYKDLESINYRTCRLRVVVNYVINNQLQRGDALLAYDSLHQPADHAVFKLVVEPIQVVALQEFALMCQ